MCPLEIKRNLPKSKKIVKTHSNLVKNGRTGSKSGAPVQIGRIRPQRDQIRLKPVQNRPPHPA